MNSMLNNPSGMDKQVLQKFLDLPQPEDKILVTYCWIDDVDQSVRTKTLTLDFEPKDISELSWWIVGGNTYEHGECFNFTNLNVKVQKLSAVDIYLKPVSIFRDPFFHLGKNKLVLCEACNSDKTPHSSNKRASCVKTMEAAKESHPMFSIKQEYSLVDRNGWPFGWPKPHGYPFPQGSYYCSVGADRSYGRDVVDAHYKACLFAGVKIHASNADPMPSKWEFQVGPLEGIHCADHLWIGRYILQRIAEELGVVVAFDEKPIGDCWNEPGSHVINYSTQAMRQENGIKYIEEAIGKLRCADENKKRVETTSSCFNDISDRIRIPRDVLREKKGYLEDRRAASNSDPYLVTEQLVRTTVLNETD